LTDRAQLLVEIEETEKDLKVFHSARDLIRGRVQEVVDDNKPRALPSVANWSGTDCVLGGLDLTVHALERTLEELKAAFDLAPEDQPRLRLVETE